MLGHYPFGSIMPGRTVVFGTQYRFGFNEKENDNEVKGPGNQQDYGMRIYDPRVGRFLSVDPISSDYPFYSAYQFAGNKPIWAVDLDGLEEYMKSQERMLTQRAKVMMKPRDPGSIRPYNPSDKAFAEKWRDSKNFFAKMTYDAANGLYTLPQQLTASIRGADYITNIGGNVHRSRGTADETKRTGNFVNGTTLMIPGAPEGQALKSLAFSDELMRIGIAGSDDFSRASAYEIARAGGTHAGFLNNYLDKSVKELQGGIKSFTKRIEMHENLIADPEKYMKLYEKGDWNLLDPRRQDDLLKNKWPGDIKRLQEQKEILETLLKTKKT